MKWTKAQDAKLARCFVQGYYHDEIAELLNVEPREVSQRLRALFDAGRPIAETCASAEDPAPPPAEPEPEVLPCHPIPPIGEIALAANVPGVELRQPKVDQGTLYQCLAKVAIALTQEEPELERAKAAIDDVLRPKVVRVGHITESTVIGSTELLDVRTCNRLEEAGVLTFADLLVTTDAQLLRFKHVGPKFVANVGRVREDIRNVFDLRKKKTRRA